jgi:tetratricopeptide (TPR) repeat protein
MAPEQAQANATPVGPRADVYALGAILYELLTGRPPFKAATPMETVLQVLHADPVPPRRFQPAVPRDLETICLTCLHKEPRRRYTDAEALAEDLRRFLAAEPIRARPAGWWERTAKWARRRPAAAALIGVSVLAVLLLLLTLQRAHIERDRAVRVVEGALDTLSRITGFDNGGLSGSEPEQLRRQLGNEVSTFYERLLADTEMQGESVRQRVGTIHFELGQIYRNLGQPEQALQHLRAACDLREQLVAAFPDNEAYGADLANSYLNLSGSLEVLSQAEALCLKARDLCERLVRQHPNFPDPQARLAQCYHVLGSIYRRAQPEQCRECFAKAVALAEQIVRSNPRDTQYRVRLAEHYIMLALFRPGPEKPDEAAAFADKAVQVLETVTRDEPQIPYYADRLGSAYINQGFVATTAGRLEQALASYTRAAEVLEAAYRKAPHWIDVRGHLASAHGGQANTLMYLNRPVESLPHWKRLFELDEGPSGNAFRLRYGLALIQAGDHAEAATQAQVLVAAANTSGEMLYDAACVYSLCSHAVREDQKTSADYQELLAEKYAVRAIEALHKADAAEAFKSPADREHLKNDPDLAPLLTRKDFQALLRALEQRSS